MSGNKQCYTMVDVAIFTHVEMFITRKIVGNYIYIYPFTCLGIYILSVSVCSKLVGSIDWLLLSCIVKIHCSYYAGCQGGDFIAIRSDYLSFMFTETSNPSVVTVSGFVFSNACIFKYVSQVMLHDLITGPDSHSTT